MTVDFDGFVGMIKSLLEDCINDPMTYKTLFMMENEDGCAYFYFRHNSVYKTCDIVRLAFR